VCDDPLVEAGATVVESDDEEDVDEDDVEED
jgi:hypothetical protein